MNHRNRGRPLRLLTLALALFSCERFEGARKLSPVPVSPADGPSNAEEELPDLAAAIASLTGRDTYTEPSALAAIIDRADLPPDLAFRLKTAAAENPAFIMDLMECLNGDPFLRRLVDKTRPLPPGYEPEDLVDLEPGSYELGRQGMKLRRAAAEGLEKMAAAARSQGIVLVASSAYRSYDYQVQVYNRIVGELGQEAADRESARPGHSQHQTGLALDFGSIDDSFAQTRVGRWIKENGSRFGWSISFPDGYEAVTGYRWESWHYRYVGEDLAAFIDTWFGGIQQYALQFIHAWEEAG
ncbi:MAG: M15 family metallopeptidase [Treponema sp.]|nr:M15 family metallopeptidase [Treponema sp.]